MLQATPSQSRFHLLSYQPRDLLNESESDSDSDCENEEQHQHAHFEKKFSILKRHDQESYDQWTLMYQQVGFLTAQNEVLEEENQVLQEEINLVRQIHQLDVDKWNKIRFALDTTIRSKKTVISLLEKNVQAQKETIDSTMKSIKDMIETETSSQKMVYALQKILALEEVRKNGYV